MSYFKGMSIFRWLEYQPTEEEKKKYSGLKRPLWTMVATFSDENVKCF